MTEDINRELVRQVVEETIRALRKDGLLRESDDVAYTDVSETLRGYYDSGERDKVVGKALKTVSGDSYYKIIPLFFRYGYTIERIADYFGVEVSTITRNKKRLCLQIYRLIE